jgi:iron transport multicopper oxidase
LVSTVNGREFTTTAQPNEAKASLSVPTIEADVGDTIVVTAHNNLGNETTSLHFHGMFQKGTGIYDGATGLTACSIQPGDSYTYQFVANPAGTHWYHSHDKGQYPDGLRGKMIIHDRSWEISLKIDSQIYLSMSDWYVFIDIKRDLAHG